MQKRSRTTDVRRLRLPKLPPRRGNAHKGDFGRVLAIGGSRGMVGAPALVANAALRSGAGLVTVACPEGIQQAVATLAPCATSLPLPQLPGGAIDPAATRELMGSNGWFTPAGAPDVVAAGPGLGRGDRRFDRELTALLLDFGRRARVPVVLDADALNALHKSDGDDSWDRVRRYRTVITPHPGELARLQNTTTKEIQAARPQWALRTAREMTGDSDDPDDRVVVVLKGAATIVTDGRGVYVNRTGNNGMATGGAGDVLTGIIAGLIAQGLSTLDAAVLGVHLHGLAGDLAARVTGPHSLIATDLIDYLPGAFARLRR